MALNFPNDPTNGQEYVASNGIVYTYDSATDTWTGALGGNDYWSQTDDGSGDIYVTDTNASVGIGTDSPGTRLTLGSKSAIGGGNYITFGARSNTLNETNLPFIGNANYDTGNADLGLGARSSNGAIRFYTGNTEAFDPDKERVTILKGGNVGINTDSPDQKLDVNGKIRFTALDLNNLAELPD